MSNLGKYLIATGSVYAGPAAKRSKLDKLIFSIKRLLNLR